jgi:glycosyltransferase involved in cell wall biosynthesis
MSTGPLFSVIVTTWDRPAFLSEALRSVRAQTVEDWECLVVHDAGPGRIELPDDPRFRLIRRELNGGAAACRNTGVEHAKGRFVVFLDDDDAMAPTRLELAMTGASRAPVVICWTRFMDHPPGGNRVLEGDVRGTLHEGLVPAPGATAVQREAFVPFDTRFRSVEDVEWWVRLVQDRQVTTVPEIGLLYRHHDGPRPGMELPQRIRENLMVLDLHPAYFRKYPRAAAFRWKRIGLIALKAGDLRLARRAFARSFRRAPSTRTVWHLARSIGSSQRPAPARSL